MRWGDAYNVYNTSENDLGTSDDVILMGDISEDGMRGTCGASRTNNEYSLVFGKLELNNPAVKTRRRWRKTLKLILKVGREGIESIYLARDRKQRWILVNAAMSHRA
jgi:hypothetical protein